VTGEARAAVPAEPWEPSSVPTQVKLVDLLQIVDMARSSRGVIRLALIASAWDVVPEELGPPRTWLHKELPLLEQFLLANSNRFATEVFGVSAQGGDLTRDSASLLSTTNAEERVTVVCGTAAAASHDITLPLSWALRVD
jgi:hypothetical protein